MSNVICKRNCKYRNSVYCGRDFTVLNSLGQCSIYFAENGQPRVFPLYPIEDVIDPQPPQQENEVNLGCEEEKGENDGKLGD